MIGADRTDITNYNLYIKTLDLVNFIWEDVVISDKKFTLEYCYGAGFCTINNENAARAIFEDDENN